MKNFGHNELRALHELNLRACRRIFIGGDADYFTFNMPTVFFTAHGKFQQLYEYTIPKNINNQTEWR